MNYITIITSTGRVSMPAQYVQGDGFVFTPWGWLSSIPANTLIQAPGAFMVRG